VHVGTFLIKRSGGGGGSSLESERKHLRGGGAVNFGFQFTATGTAHISVCYQLKQNR
jgi:hypothetical protein